MATNGTKMVFLLKGEGGLVKKRSHFGSKRPPFFGYRTLKIDHGYGRVLCLLFVCLISCSMRKHKGGGVVTGSDYDNVSTLSSRSLN